MLDNILRPWRSRDDLRRNLEAGDNLTQTPTERKTRLKQKLQLNTSNISRPIQRSPQSLTGFDGYDDSSNGNNQWHSSPSPSSSRSGPSNIAWLRTRDSVGEDDTMVPTPSATAVIQGSNARHTHPMSRSISTPVTSAYSHSTSRLGMNPAHAGSSHSLRLDPNSGSRVSNLYGNSYSYPGVKTLSPIAEQDYFSPESLRRNIPLPGDRKVSLSTDGPGSSPAGSYSSEVTRPSPVHSIPFLTRPVNRSLSQSTHRSGLSTITPTSTVAPSLPPLDLRPPFPGPHPSQEGDGPPMRLKKSLVPPAMPTIAAGSSDEYQNDEDEDEDEDVSSYGGGEDEGEGEEASSLHAESFVTASDSSHVPGVRPGSGSSLQAPPVAMIREDRGRYFPAEISTTHDPIPVAFVSTNPSMIQSSHSSQSPPSPSESFIRRRWEKDASYPSGKVTLTLKPKHQWTMCSTPAFWAFWLGFLCPVLWLVGGWHFTNFGEQPPRLTFWEFYFNAGYWKEVLCCVGKRRKEPDAEQGQVQGEEGKGKGRAKAKTTPALPRWVTAKQSSEGKITRLNDPRRSLRGISFGYPFVPRPFVPSNMPQTRLGPAWRVMRMVTRTLSKPHRFFDQIYGVELKSVKGKSEGRRRMFDPWIQRCRYAFCYAMIVMCAGLGTAATCLIIFNTRDLR